MRWAWIRSHVIYLHHLTGTRSLLATVAVADLASSSAYLRRELDVVPGVRAHHAELLVTTYGEASRWRLGTLEPAQRETVIGDTAARDEPVRPLDERDEQLIRTLTTDARLPNTELATRLGVSEPTARRRLGRLLSEGRMRMRCEIAQSVSGWPVTAVLRCRVPAARLDSVARSVAALPEIRLSVGLTGPENLHLIAWLRDASGLPALEASLATRFPELTVVRSAVSLRTLKHMGRLLDERGLAVGSTPMDIWRPPVATRQG
ncbi:AsnC family transcriptional regulator [Streptomyces sp. NPDC001606]